jgi:uncharacterized protein (DUF4415 family)
MPVKKRVTKRVWVDLDDAPEWTKRQFDRAEIAVGGKVVSPARGTLTRPRGRPKKPDAKVHTHIRLSPQVLGHFRATGPGWQMRIDEGAMQVGREESQAIPTSHQPPPRWLISVEEPDPISQLSAAACT